MLTLPFPRNPFFTGREDQLAAIHTALTSRGRSALSGLGGIGKTQTAVEYAYRYRGDYCYVFWVGADTELKLTSGYVAIAQRLDLSLKDAENQDETVQYVRLWLSRETGWLLIFDNGDRPELVQPFLPSELQGHILVTSRAQDFQDLSIVQPVTMETLNPEEAVTFLLTRTGRTPSVVGAHPRVRPPQGIEPLVDHPDGQSAVRQDAIPPTPLEKGGSESGVGAEDLFPPNPLGKGGSSPGVTTDNSSPPLLSCPVCAMINALFEPFVEASPLTVMMRAIMERIFAADKLDALFEQVADRQYTRTLLFSSVVGLMGLVVSGIHLRC